LPPVDRPGDITRETPHPFFAAGRLDVNPEVARGFAADIVAAVNPALSVIAAASPRLRPDRRSLENGCRQLAADRW
jgi:hypothetical protein